MRQIFPRRRRRRRLQVLSADQAAQSLPEICDQTEKTISSLAENQSPSSSLIESQPNENESADENVNANANADEGGIYLQVSRV